MKQDLLEMTFTSRINFHTTHPIAPFRHRLKKKISNQIEGKSKLENLIQECESRLVPYHLDSEVSCETYTKITQKFT